MFLLDCDEVYQPPEAEAAQKVGTTLFIGTAVHRATSTTLKSMLTETDPQDGVPEGANMRSAFATGIGGSVSWQEPPSTAVTGVEYGAVRYHENVDDLLTGLPGQRGQAIVSSVNENDDLQLTEAHLQTTHHAQLIQLAEEFGCSWALVAKVVGVSIPEIRRWRGGGEITDAHQQRLARLVAAFESLARVGIDSPALWLDRRIWPDVPVRRFEALALDDSLVLAYAAGQCDAIALLNAVVPRWRNLYLPEHSEVTFNAASRPTIHIQH